MRIELAIAGLGCLSLALGHAVVGRWVLPGLSKLRLPSTPFGSGSMSVGMVRFTWHVVTMLLLAITVLLISVGWGPDTNPRTLLLRWLATFWLAVAVMGFWMARHRLTNLLRLPVPLVNLLIAAMCWAASTSA